MFLLLQVGEVVAKSRRGSLKLRFDLPVLVAADKREFWYPAQARLCPPHPGISPRISGGTPRAG